MYESRTVSLFSLKESMFVRCTLRSSLVRSEFGSTLIEGGEMNEEVDSDASDEGLLELFLYGRVSVGTVKP